MSILIRIGRALSANLALTPLLDTVYREVSRLFDTTNFYIALNPPGTDQLLFPLNYEHGKPSPLEIRTMGRSMTGHVVRTGQPLFLPIFAEKRMLLEREQIVSMGTPPKSWMGVPLRSHDAVFGVMAIQSYEREGAYSEEDLELFSAIASQLGTALRNVQLFEAAERRARETKIISAIGRDILSTLDQASLLGRIVASVQGMLTQDCVAIFFDENGTGQYGALAACGPIEAQLRVLTVEQGKGILGSIAQSGRSEIIPHCSSDPRAIYIPDTPIINQREKLMAVPLFDQGEVTGLIAVWRSNSEPSFQARDLVFLEQIGRQASVAIRNAQLYGQAEGAVAEAEAANRAKSSFLAGMSHELRTPLNAILLYSELLMEEMTDQGIHDLAMDIGKIQSASKQLLSLIDDILDLSKIEAGRMPIFIETCDLLGVLGEAVEMAMPLIAKNGNQFLTHIDPGLTTLHTDHRKIRQVLSNLLGTAAKFTREGVIRLNAARDPENPRNACFLISDTGVGMSPEQLDRSLQAFLHVDDSTSYQLGGTGLSLALCQKLTDLLGGDIRVESRSGKGTAFVVRIPGLEVHAAS